MRGVYHIINLQLENKIKNIKRTKKIKEIKGDDEFNGQIKREKVTPKSKSINH